MTADKTNGPHNHNDDGVGVRAARLTRPERLTTSKVEEAADNRQEARPKPALRVRMVMCAATGDIPVASVLRWLPEGSEAGDVLAIGAAWTERKPGLAWQMARDLVDAKAVAKTARS